MRHKECCLCIVEDKKQHKLLMIRHKRGINQGFFNFPGGKVEEGENIEEAVVRELFEETGIVPLDIQSRGRIDIQPKPQSQLYHDFNHMHVYLFYTDNFEGDLKAAASEVDVFWQDMDRLPLQNMRDNDSYWVKEVLDGKSVHKVFHSNKKGRMTSVENYPDEVDEFVGTQIKILNMVSKLQNLH